MSFYFSLAGPKTEKGGRVGHINRNEQLVELGGHYVDEGARLEAWSRS